MTLPLLFASGVRLQLHEREPALPTKLVHNRVAFGENHSVRAQVRWPDGREGYASLFNPRKTSLGFLIAIEPPGAWKAAIYATRKDILPLTKVAADVLLSPPVVPFQHIHNGWVAEDVTVWYTASARNQCANDDMERHGIVLEADLTASPRTSDLFGSPEFWMLLSSFRGTPECGTTAGALADFVQERGFDRLVVCHG